MKRQLFAMALAMAAALSLVVIGCTEETGTDIGGPLLPGHDVETFEVVLEPDQYLENDTAFSGYTKPVEAGFLTIARDFEGVLNANALFRYGRAPTTLQVRDSAGTVRTDTLPRYPSGVLVLLIDTLTSRGVARSVAVYLAAESWDAATATWTVRSDTGGVRQLWQMPGGTLGPLIGRGAWQPGRDSVTVPLDSAQVAALAGANDTTRNVVVTADPGATAGGSRLRVLNSVLRLAGRSSIRADTTIAVNVDVATRTFVFTPDPPTVTSAARVSGVPAWRSFLTVRENLRDFTVPCPTQPAPCSIPLRDVHINTAELLLRPTGSPAGFSPEDSIRVLANSSVEGGVNVPLERSPIANLCARICASRAAMPPARFTTGDSGPPLAVTLTEIVSAIVKDTATVATSRAPRRIALLSLPEAATLGFASFLSAPRLRLVLTTTEQR